MNEIKVLPIDWPIKIVKGDKQRPITVTVVDVDGEPVPGFTWLLEVLRNWRDTVHEFSGSGESNGTFLLDLTNDFEVGSFTYKLKVFKNSWRWTKRSGDFCNTDGSERGSSRSEDFTIELPIRFNPETGEYESFDETFDETFS